MYITDVYNLDMFLDISNNITMTIDTPFTIFTPFSPVINLVYPRFSEPGKTIYIRNNDLSNPFNFSTMIHCLFEYEIKDDITDAYESLVTAKWINTHFISCIIPSTITSYHDINVSVTFDNSVLFSNKLIITIIETPSVTDININNVYPSQFILLTIKGSNFNIFRLNTFIKYINYYQPVSIS